MNFQKSDLPLPSFLGPKKLFLEKNEKKMKKIGNFIKIKNINNHEFKIKNLKLKKIVLKNEDAPSPKVTKNNE